MGIVICRTAVLEGNRCYFDASWVCDGVGEGARLYGEDISHCALHNDTVLELEEAGDHTAGAALASPFN